MERMTVNLKKQLYQIAAQCMVTIEGRGGLEYRGNDEEDFVDAILLLEDLCEFVNLGNLQVYQFFSKFLYVCHSCKRINLFLILVCD